MTATVGGLQKLVVRGLFGSRNYEIAIDPSRPTVLTGANGTGKSTLLRLVNAVSAGDLQSLSSAPLSDFELHFDALEPFVLSRGSADSAGELSWGEHRQTIPTVDSLRHLPEWARQAIRNSQIYDTELDDLLMEAARAEGVPYDEYREIRELAARESPPPALSPPEWFDDLRNAFPVLFVTDQRLVVESKREPRHTSRGPARGITSRLAVEAASSKITEQMQQVDSAYARVSQQQDRRFPRDVIAAMSQQEDVPLPDLQSLLQEVDQRRESLRAVGLLDSDQGYEPDLAEDSLKQEQVRPVIATFLKSTLEKLAVLEDLSMRLRVFQRFLNERFAGKTMQLSRREGVRFRLDTGSIIRPMQLSSGEQQMMVLAYEILFRAGDGTLVILDEPEISLHVLWQDTLIENLAEMGAAGHLQFLLATHSPVLLASHPELERSLDRLADE